MLPVGWLVLAVVVAIVLTMWVTFTVTRLDRLHARVDAAQAALDAQLVRRAAALLGLAESPDAEMPLEDRVRYETISRTALSVVEPDQRQGVENAVGRAISTLLDGDVPVHDDAGAELRESATRVLIARRFYNDAVRDTRTLRMRRMPRLLRLAGHRDLPQFFDIDDTVPAASAPPEPAAPVPTPTPDPEEAS